MASIKLSAGEGTFIGTNRARGFRAENAPLRRLIADAYGVPTFQIYGGPGWIDSENYDILAKREVNPKAGQIEKESFETNWADMLLRLQTLLEDRCSLKFHRETKELPVYALTVAKRRLKLQPSSCRAIDLDNPVLPPAPRLLRTEACGSLQSLRNGLNMITTGTGVAMTDLIRWLSIATHRTVIDKTGFAEKFSFTVEWTPDAAVGPSPAGTEDPSKSAPPADTTGRSLASALEEKLGLNLRSAKGPVEVFVIDYIEKPSAN